MRGPAVGGCFAPNPRDLAVPPSDWSGVDIPPTSDQRPRLLEGVESGLTERDVEEVRARVAELEAELAAD